MLQHGILHESSCVYRPVQNGVAEHKNSHLLEVARVLLINRMPSAFSVTQPNITNPKSLMCVLLGYSCIQKGYKCYSPQLHRYLISRDVFFHEDLPYFPVITYRHQEDLIREPSSHLKDAPIDLPYDAPNNVSNDVPTLSDTYSDSNAPNDALSGSDSPRASPGGFDAPSDAPGGFDSPT
ncbi:polyprotein [Tanacetum coccineum]